MDNLQELNTYTDNMQILSTILLATILALSGAHIAILHSIRDITDQTTLGVATTPFPQQGGTGTSTRPTEGQILMGNQARAYSLNTLTAGSGVTITNATNSITIATAVAVFPWTPRADGNATTTRLLLDNGLISSASTTIASNLHLSGVLNASSSATSTFANGIQLDGGCLLIGGNCLVDTDTDTDTNLAWMFPSNATGTLLAFNGGLMSGASSTISSNLLVSGVLNASSSLSVAGGGYFGGNVGIGTTSPSGTLHILTGSPVGATPNAVANDLVLESDTASGMTFLTGSGGINYIEFGDDQSSTQGEIRYVHSSDTLDFATNGTTRLTINSLGNIGVGTSTPGARFSVQGNGLLSGNLSLAGLTATGTVNLQSATVQQHLYPAFSYATSTWSGTTTRQLGTAFVSETWNTATCYTTVGTVNISFSDGTNLMNMISASATPARFSLSTNNTFTQDEKRQVAIGTPASSPVEVSCTIDKTINN